VAKSLNYLVSLNHYEDLAVRKLSYIVNTNPHQSGYRWSILNAKTYNKGNLLRMKSQSWNVVLEKRPNRQESFPANCH